MDVTWRLGHQRHPALFALRLIPAMIIGLPAGLVLVSQRTYNQTYLRTYRSSREIDLLKQGEDLCQKKFAALLSLKSSTMRNDWKTRHASTADRFITL